jgi:hypothetical protein
LLINAVVDPESKNTLSSVLDLTEEMVSTTIIVTGGRFLGTVLLGMTTSLAQPFSSDIAHTSSAHVSIMGDSFSIFGGFLVEPRLKFVLKWAVLLNLTFVYYELILIRILQFK